ncbi:apoptosis-inducing factor 3-like isoform X2 [Agrilus planipennis]|uniref:Apoptosis-inducing factor 3-like isoform X2 n=1 Tax=Agrilus planipennis TaxID=224129 RepID=A0A1W4XNL8_AGRPL|nr:apoptosis-inducing factor 3-like isoform X2 [Agrilus planipennis]
MGCKCSKQSADITSADGRFGGEDDEEYIEKAVCEESELKDNEMKIFELEDDESVLVVKQGGQITALGTRCTHYGAPLDKAALGEGRIRCQWHGACFNVLNGDIEDYPGVDSLPCYQVKVEKNQVKVRAKRSLLELNRRTKIHPKIDAYENTTVVLVGAGPSSATCAETLREEGFKGKIIMIGEEPYLPYDRVKVSKAMTSHIDDIQLRNEEFYKNIGVEVIKKTKVVCVNPSEKFVTTSTGQVINYDKLYIATGVTCRRLQIPGGDLNNIFVLKDYDDAQGLLKQLAPDKHVVCIGASFIGMEGANSVKKKVAKVTVVSHRKVPFERSFGLRIGEAFLNLYKEKGVDFAMERKHVKITGDENGNVTGVELDDGTVLKADIIILGIGSYPTTGFLKDSGIQLHTDHAIDVNEYLETNIPDIYAGGDVAHAPVWSRDNYKATIGHYGLAQMHAKIAALNMIGKKTPLRAVPFFWTVLYGKSVQYAGHGETQDIIYAGNVEQFNFIAYYLINDEVVGVAGCQMYPTVAQFAELLAQGRKLYRKDIESDPLEWTKTVARAKDTKRDSNNATNGFGAINNNSTVENTNTNNNNNTH